MAQSILSYTVEDADGDQKSIPLYWPDTDINAADLQDASDTIATFLDAVIDGKIVAANLTRGIDLPSGLKASAVANSEVQKGALLHFRRAGQTRIYSIWVPSWTPAKFSGDTVNNGAAGVSTFTAAIVSGVVEASGNVMFSDEFGNDLNLYVDGEKTFRK